MKSTVVIIFLATILATADLLIANTFITLKIPRVLAQNTQTASPTPVPTPSPTPAPSPSPSPVYTGFCQNVPILLYHHIQPQEQAKEKNQGFITVDPQTFDAQMNYLKSTGYQTISLDELSRSLINRQKLPAKSIVITADDGYKDNFTYAYPIIQKYNHKLNLMISTGLVENPDYLSWNDIKQMTGSGLVTAYNHTWSHANLAAVTSQKLESEILTAQKQLQENLGKTPTIFAYPYGSENNNVINFLIKNNFTAALSTIPGTIQCDSFIMSLHRTRIGNSSLASYGL